MTWLEGPYQYKAPPPSVDKPQFIYGGGGAGGTFF